MNKPVLACDYDDVISRSMESWLSEFNFQTNENVTKDMLLEWDIHKFIKPEHKEYIYWLLEDQTKSNMIYKSAKPYENAVEVTQWLQEYFDIWIVTSAYPNNLAPKSAWLQRYFPHIPTRQICVINDKPLLLKADWIIDDKLATVKHFKHGLLFNQNWNLKYDYPKEKRFDNWLQIQSYFQRLINLGILKKEVA